MAQNVSLGSRGRFDTDMVVVWSFCCWSFVVVVVVFVYIVSLGSRGRFGTDMVAWFF